MTEHSDISNRAEFISEALKEASKLVGDLDEKYREPAFPIVLRSLLDGNFATKASPSSLPAQNGEIPQAESSMRLSSDLSVNAFFQMANPDSHVGRFVCAAYYLFYVRRVEQFSIADILEIYGKLRIKKPQNPSDTLNQCIRKVHIIDAPAVNGQKNWVITSAGEIYVEELLNASANAKKPAH